MPVFAIKPRLVHPPNFAANKSNQGFVWSVLAGLLLFNSMLLGIAASVHAQTPQLNPGDAVITHFSGVSSRTNSTGESEVIIDPEGIVAEAVDLRNPGSPPAGMAWRDIPKKLQIHAREIGQVFGIAFDDQSPANIYLTATSAFGLHIDDETGTWMQGQWAPDGGPGTIYKLNAEENYKPEIFARINLQGRPNSGAGLGNIAFDRKSRNLYVSDLETGMIHRLGLDGTILGQYDHGVTGRSQFFDSATGEDMTLPAVEFDPETGAQIGDCESGEFSFTPQCWNIADFRRRVWGLAPYSDPASGKTRLYYAVWASQAFDNPDWGADTTEQQNTVWSVGLSDDGAFRSGDVRREFVMPGFFATAEDYDRAGGSSPVSDIAFSENGDMALAERGGMRNLGLGKNAPFAWPDEARIIRAQKNENGIWVPVGRHDVSWYDRKELSQPYVRAAGGGGVDFGFGYSVAGQLADELTDTFVWATGDGLCRADGPCSDGTAQTLNGIQGQPADAMADLNPDSAFGECPAAGPATPADGPANSYHVEIVSVETSSWTGDVEIFKGAGQSGDSPPSAGSPPISIPPVTPGEPDLAVVKHMPERCYRGGICTARIAIFNAGTSDWSGPLFLRDFTEPGSLGFSTAGAPWQCASITGETVCYHPPVTLASGQSLSLLLDIGIGGDFAYTNITNCAAVDWPLANPGNPASVVAAVQKALTLLGYNPGPVDGAMGPKTSTAIAAAQADFGIPVTGVIDSDLLDVLFSGYSVWPGDRNPGNDQSCDNSTIINTPPPGGVHLPIGSRPGHLTPASVHLPIGSSPAHVFPSSVHLPIGSGPAHVFPNSVHLPIGSNPGHLFPNSVHLPIGSNPGHKFPNSVHLPIGSGGHKFPNSIHLPIGSVGGHLFPNSIHLPIGSNPGHKFPNSIHLPVGSGGHVFPQSLHLPIGSNPGHKFPQSIHLPVGSNPGHKFPNSVHFPIGSNPGHKFPQSIHLPIGSNPGHKFPASLHLPIGSVGGHDFPNSIHLPLGSNQGHDFPLSVHLPIGSKPEHKFPASLHVPVGSKGGHEFPNSIHLPIGSNPEHNLPNSIHLPIGSKGEHKFPNSIHLPIGSAGHQPKGSLHFPVGSGGHKPAGSVHSVVISKGQLHEVAKSTAHKPAGSIHLPVGSGGHLPAGSLHSVAVSKGQLHEVAKSTAHKPAGSIHLPIGSKPQVHLPVGSKPQIHLPVGSVLTHKPAGSKPQIHLPIGSKPQVHLPVGSKPQVHKPRGSIVAPNPPQVHLPVGSKPQVHKPRGSIVAPSPPQVHLPVGSKPQVHKPRGSIVAPNPPQVHLPVGSKPQVHKPRGSIVAPNPPQVHLPVGSKPQVHKPRGSIQVAPQPQTHQPAGSIQIIRPKKPAPQVQQPSGSQTEVHSKRQSAARPILKLQPRLFQQLQQ